MKRRERSGECAATGRPVLADRQRRSDGGAGIGARRAEDGAAAPLPVASPRRARPGTASMCGGAAAPAAASRRSDGAPPRSSLVLTAIPRRLRR